MLVALLLLVSLALAGRSSLPEKNVMRSKRVIAIRRNNDLSNQPLYRLFAHVLYDYPTWNSYEALMAHDADGLTRMASTFDKAGQALLCTVAQAMGTYDTFAPMCDTLSNPYSIASLEKSLKTHGKVNKMRLDQFSEVYCRYSALFYSSENPYNQWLVEPDVLLRVATHAAERNALAFRLYSTLFRMPLDMFNTWLDTARNYQTNTSLAIAHWHGHDASYARAILSRMDGLCWGTDSVQKARLSAMLPFALLWQADISPSAKAEMEALTIERLDDVLSALHERSRHSYGRSEMLSLLSYVRAIADASHHSRIDEIVKLYASRRPDLP